VLVGAGHSRAVELFAVELSGGRLEFAIGASGGEIEHTMLGIALYTAGERIRRLGEALTDCRKLCAEEHASFAGRYYTLTDAVSNPKPLQRLHPRSGSRRVARRRPACRRSGAVTSGRGVLRRVARRVGSTGTAGRIASLTLVEPILDPLSARFWLHGIASGVAISLPGPQRPVLARWLHVGAVASNPKM
jgi:Luciferase-like monooxygenase